MKTYNGHRSYSAWNVALWISSDYEQYENVRQQIHIVGENACMPSLRERDYGTGEIPSEEKIQDIIKTVTNTVAEGLLETFPRTPDGIKTNKLTLSLAIEDFVKETIEGYFNEGEKND